MGLLEYALHLRQHGEHAPGGNETWAEFDQRCERFLRNPSARPAPHLEAVKRERDALAVLNAELKAEAAHWRAVAERHLTQLGEVARALGTARYQNQLLSAELASARQEHLHCPIPTEEKP